MESPRTLSHPAVVREPSPEEGAPIRRLPRPATPGPRPGQASGEGLVLGRYQLLERLGSGGFGEVWRARDELLHREVAVKRVALGPDGDSERAAREALAAARLSHPAIVALYEACPLDDAFYLISELVQGRTLAKLIATDALEDAQVLRIGIALCHALAHAHARGVIHRDIKPPNVLVPDRPEGAAGAAKLTDFGGASLADEAALTRTGDVLGTLAYMAPEQSEGREVAEEADLYSLALVLYEAFSGVNPVRGATPAATARRIGTDLEPLARSRRDLPHELTDGLDAALAPWPGDRGTLRQLREALEEALGQHPHGATREYAPRWREPPLAGPAPRSHAPPALAAPPAGAARAQESEPSEEPQRRLAGRMALPRAVWIGAGLALIGWQAAAGRPGLSLLLLAGLLPLAALPRRAGPAWLSSGLAPLLGLAGLAGVFPAVAGQGARWRQRAMLGALGYWWLAVAEPLLARALWLGPAPGTPARAVWEGSLQASATHVIAPLLSLGVLLGAALWAAGSMTLPWVVRGRSAALDVVAAVMWSAAIVTAAPELGGGLGAHAAHPSPRGAVLGAVLAALLAVAARALRGPV